MGPEHEKNDSFHAQMTEAFESLPSLHILSVYHRGGYPLIVGHRNFDDVVLDVHPRDTSLALLEPFDRFENALNLVRFGPLNTVVVEDAEGYLVMSVLDSSTVLCGRFGDESIEGRIVFEMDELAAQLRRLF